jgi:hypothetical protein
MVSKFKTVENGAVACLIFFGLAMSTTSFADPSGEPTNPRAAAPYSSERSGPSYDEWKKSCDDQKNAAASSDKTFDLLSCYQKWQSKVGNDSSFEGCDADYKAWTDALKELKSACGTIKNQNKIPKLQSFACTEALDYCKCAEYGEDEEPPGTCSNVPYEPLETESSRNSSSGSSLIDLNLEHRKLTYCPSMGNTDFKDFKKEVEDTQKDVDELEDKIPDLQKAVDDVQKNLGDTLSDLEKEKVAAQKEYRDGLKTIKRDMKGAVKAVTEQITTIEQNISKIEADIRGAVLSKTTAQLQHNDGVKDILNTCIESAEKEVSARRLELFKRIQAGQINRGNFGAALKNVGLSDRKSDQDLADKLYTNCKNSKRITDLVTRADQKLELALKGIDESINSMMIAKQQARDSISKLRTEQGCGAANTDPTGQHTSQMCQAIQDAQEDMTDLQKTASETATTIANKVKKANVDAYNENATRQDALMKAKTRLARDQQYLDDKRQLLSMKMKLGGSGTMKPDDVMKAFAADGSVKGAAETLAQTCCATTPTDQKGRSICKSVHDYYEGLNMDWPDSPDDNNIEAKANDGTTAGQIVTGEIHTNPVTEQRAEQLENQKRRAAPPAGQSQTAVPEGKAKYPNGVPAHKIGH